MLGSISLFLSIILLSEAARSVRYVEYRPPVVTPEVGPEGITLPARQNYQISCKGHKPLTWLRPANNSNSDTDKRVKVTQSQDDAGSYTAHLEIQHLVYTDTGSYVCSFDDSQDRTSPESNTEVYIYVFDEINLLTHSGFDFQQSVAYKSAQIPCRPTHPDISVSLTLQGKGLIDTPNEFIKFNPQVGFIISPVTPENSGQYWCHATYGGKTSEYGISLNVLMETRYVPPPQIERTSGGQVTVGGTLVMTCSVSVSWTVMVSLSWELPNKAASPPRLLWPDPTSRNVSIGGTHLKVVEQKLVLHNVDKVDQGSYACVVKDHSDNQQVRREFVRIYERDQSFLRVWQDGFTTLHKSSGSKDETVQWVVEIASHPPPRVTWYDPEGEVIEEGEDSERGRTVQTVLARTSRSMLRLTNLRLEDSGQYRIKVENGQLEKWENFTLVVTEPIKVSVRVLEPSSGGLYQFGVHYTLRCLASGYPTPSVSWTFKSCQDYEVCKEKAESIDSTKDTKGRVETESLLSVVASRSGLYTCMACTSGDCQMDTQQFFVTSLTEGFQVSGPTQAVEGDAVSLQCSASQYNYSASSLGWYKQVGRRSVPVTRLRKKSSRSDLQVVDSPPSNFDIGSRLKFDQIRPGDTGVYVCRAKRTGGDGAVVEKKMNLTVQQMEYPEFVETFNMGDTMYVKTDETVEMKCVVRGVPKPTVSWYLNDTAIDFNKDLNFILSPDGQSLRLATVVAGKSDGRFACKASNRAGIAHLEQNIVKVESPQIYETNLVGSDQIIHSEFMQSVEPGSSLNFTCRATGTPTPHITWRFNGSLLRPGQGMLVNRRQTLIIRAAGPADQGRYECVASNIGGSVSRYQVVTVTQSPQPASVFTAHLAIPLYIAIGVALLIAVLTLLGIKYCCRRSLKSPGTPPTPRLTQYEQPEDTESCRLTSPASPASSQETFRSEVRSCQGNYQQECSACQYNYNQLYCSHGPSLPPQDSSGLPGPILGSSLIGVRSCYSPTPPHYPSYAPSIPSPMSDFTNYSQYSQNTLPLRMETLNREISKRLQERQSRVSPPAPV